MITRYFRCADCNEIQTILEFLLVLWIFMSFMRNACINWMWFEMLRRFLVQHLQNPLLNSWKSIYKTQWMDCRQNKWQSAEFRDVCKDCSNKSNLLVILGEVYCVPGKTDIPPGAPGKCHCLDWLTQISSSGELHGFHCRVSYRGPFLLVFNIFDKLREKKPVIGSLC